ncbi:oxidoreductase [Phytohalomonas tamaricis]|uniref:oxidoreductase n=1 Tax=Phytohalomonas tamaricis TaxID=2081032 RepID=UPI000D0BB6F8|nr:oxidoreductase [Phytohalomonas tamaricis]
MTLEAPSVWFITGCSSGFGRELAKAVLANGDHVVVTARDPRKIEDLVEDVGERGIAVPLDVTDESQVKAAVERAEQHFGHIDVLVNNAGYGYTAAIEEGEDEQIKALFETNVFGLARMTRAVLPGMRQRGSGRIVNISSAGGIVGNAGTGYYASSKFAVEGLSDALAKEVEPLGIQVILIEPGPFRTDWPGRSLHRSNIEIEAYEPTAGQRARSIMDNAPNWPGDPVRAAAAIIKATCAEQPPHRLVLGKVGLDLVRAKLDAMKTDFDAWEDVTLSADFPSA